MVFLVEVEKGTSAARIYFSPLLPIDIDSYLAETNKKKIKIQLAQLDLLQFTSLYIICLNFLRDRDVCAGRTIYDLGQLEGIKEIRWVVVQYDVKRHATSSGGG